MKKVILFFGLFGFFIPCFSQYTVTKVIGNVKNRVSGEMLKTGSKFSDTNVLVFPPQKYMIRAIVTGKGVVVINSDAQPEKKRNVTKEILAYTFHVKSREAYLSGRGVTDELLPDALTTDTLYNARNLFEKENKYLFDKIAYQVANGDKFFLQVSSPGSEPLIRSLRTKEDTLIIFAADFQIANKEGHKTATYTLAAYSQEKNSSEPLLEIKPYVDVSGEMETIIKAMIKESAERDKPTLQQLCYREVYEALGKPSMIEFRNLFEKNVGKQ